MDYLSTIQYCDVSPLCTETALTFDNAHSLHRQQCSLANVQALEQLDTVAWSQHGQLLRSIVAEVKWSQLGQCPKDKDYPLAEAWAILGLIKVGFAIPVFFQIGS